MIIDSLLNFSTAQAVTSTGDTVSTNWIDTGFASDEGIGESTAIVVTVGAAVTSAGAATVQYVVQTSANNSSWSDVMMTDAIGKATLVAGHTRMLRLPQGVGRYVRLVYRVGTAALSAGTFTANLVKDAQVQASYPSGFTMT